MSSQPSVEPSPLYSKIRNAFIDIMEGIYSVLYNRATRIINNEENYSNIRLRPQISSQFQRSFQQAKSSMLSYVCSFTFNKKDDRPTNSNLRDRFREVNSIFLDKEMSDKCPLMDEEKLYWEYMSQLHELSSYFAMWMRRLDADEFGVL